jgi:hypothetical protein
MMWDYARAPRKFGRDFGDASREWWWRDLGAVGGVCLRDVKDIRDESRDLSRRGTEAQRQHRGLVARWGLWVHTKEPVVQ